MSTLLSPSAVALVAALSGTARTVPAAPAVDADVWQVYPRVQKRDSTRRRSTRVDRRHPITVTRTVLPDHPGDTVHGPGSCRVNFSYDGERWTPRVSSRCSEPHRRATAAAVAQWEFDTPRRLDEPTFWVELRFGEPDDAQPVKVSVEPSRLALDSLALDFIEMRPPKEPTRVSAPRYPDEAMGRGLGDERCIATMTIDETGRPGEITVTECNPIFHAAVTQAISNWRFAPYFEEGAPTPVSTQIPMKFRSSR